MVPPSTGGVVGVAFMVGTSWYQRKADECARLAGNSDDPDHRSRMEAESRLGVRLPYQRPVRTKRVQNRDGWLITSSLRPFPICQAHLAGKPEHESPVIIGVWSFNAIPEPAFTRAAESFSGCGRVLPRQAVPVNSGRPSPGAAPAHRHPPGLVPGEDLGLASGLSSLWRK
jgi:hypothetical protein